MQPEHQILSEQLFSKWLLRDDRRKKSAFSLLGQIEEWRLDVRQADSGAKTPGRSIRRTVAANQGCRLMRGELIAVGSSGDGTVRFASRPAPNRMA